MPSREVATQTEIVAVHFGTQTLTIGSDIDGEWELVQTCRHENVTYQGSNQYFARKTCQDCRTVWKTKGGYDGYDDVRFGRHFPTGQRQPLDVDVKGQPLRRHNGKGFKK